MAESARWTKRLRSNTKGIFAVSIDWDEPNSEVQKTFAQADGGVTLGEKGKIRAFDIEIE